ncbi:interleukin-6 receptor subunit beta-like isoform X2 [Eublepharis macularius]|uniref:Interleukin-6 receptor subunit beta-like isoform X2 n=1 Tax=Eublepharis macularius TaxID=481883 RepID=A0AA97JEC8_EUBMA|nr:interleukin-6 receptor subunit beta-like isoform X2 [Eublepharis macularius]
MQLILGWIMALLEPISCSVAPRDLKIKYCVSFWAKNITCYWDLVPETSLLTTYTLHITEEAGRCRWDFGGARSCIAAQGDRSCGIPVENLFAFYKIILTAENELGQTTQEEKCIHGLSIVKLHPPEIYNLVANQSHCFQLEWRLSGDEVLLAAEAQYQIGYHDLAETAWTQVNFTATENVPASATICGASPFTNYSVRVRAKYLPSSSLQSEETPFWSEWSTERFVRTLPTAPSRGPALWRKVGPPGSDGKREIVLMWKPLKPKEANGEILAYSLHSQREGQPAIPQCFTQDLQCTLFLQAGEGFTFFVTASNAMGTSPSTKLVVPPSGGQEAPPSQLPLLVSPASDHSLLLQWSFLRFPRMSYVFEWGRLPRKPGEERCWRYHPGSVDHVVISEAIEPGYLYDLEIFALIDGRVWGLGSTTAYSKQIAPRRAPVLNPAQIWKSQVELQWDQIPLEERGGEIRNYTICYEEEGKDGQSVVLDSSAHHYLIESLGPGSVVQVYIVATNDGGSTRGSTLSIRTKNYDNLEAEVLFSALCVGFVLILSGSLACLCKQRLIQNYLWPQIPNPAKSNLALWMPQKVCLDFPARGAEKWSTGYLGLTIGDLLRVLPSKQEEPDPKVLTENKWQVEVPGAWHKYPQPTPVIGNRTLSRKQGELPQKFPETWSEVEYARVFIIQKNNDPEESQVHPTGSLSKRQAPPSSCPGAKFGKGIWLQNMTYEALLDVGSRNMAFEVTGEFPLLVSLATVAGDVWTSESPQGDSQKQP